VTEAGVGELTAQSWSSSSPSLLFVMLRSVALVVACVFLLSVSVQADTAAVWQNSATCSGGFTESQTFVSGACNKDTDDGSSIKFTCTGNKWTEQVRTRTQQQRGQSEQLHSDLLLV
jgi:hypothetical protein